MVFLVIIWTQTIKISEWTNFFIFWYVCTHRFKKVQYMRVPDIVTKIHRYSLQLRYRKANATCLLLQYLQSILSIKLHIRSQQRREYEHRCQWYTKQRACCRVLITSLNIELIPWREENFPLNCLIFKNEFGQQK